MIFKFHLITMYTSVLYTLWACKILIGTYNRILLDIDRHSDREMRDGVSLWFNCSFQTGFDIECDNN